MSGVDMYTTLRLLAETTRALYLEHEAFLKALHLEGSHNTDCHICRQIAKVMFHLQASGHGTLILLITTPKRTPLQAEEGDDDPTNPQPVLTDTTCPTCGSAHVPCDCEQQLSYARHIEGN